MLPRLLPALFGENPDSVVENPDNGIRYIAVALNGSSLGLPEGAGVIDLETSSFEAEGDLRFADLEEAGREQLMMGISTFIGPAPLLEDPSNWNIESLRFVGAVTEEAFEVSDVPASTTIYVRSFLP